MVAIAEVPDKTAIASMLLGAGRYPLAVFIGVAGAFVIQSVVAVAFGSTISLIPRHIVHLLAGVLFIVFAAMMWWRSLGSGTEDEHHQRTVAGFWSAAGSAFLVIFIAEWGDLTQLATAALAAEHPLPLTIFCAATLALWLVSAVAIWLGHRLRASLPVRLLQRIAAVTFLVIGVLILCGVSFASKR
jgi:putative Ca2+/H+ antiporter (TMEM165/GDT1 family)